MDTLQSHKTLNELVKLTCFEQPGPDVLFLKERSWLSRSCSFQSRPHCGKAMLSIETNRKSQYSRPSVARTLMAHLPQLFRTHL